MTGLLVLIPAALFLGLLGLGAYLWALKSGQFDDMEGAASRILLDDEDISSGENQKQDNIPDATGSRERD